MLHCVLTGSCKLIDMYLMQEERKLHAVTHMYAHTGIMQCRGTRATWSYTFSHSYSLHDLLNSYHTMLQVSTSMWWPLHGLSDPPMDSLSFEAMQLWVQLSMLYWVLGCWLLAAPSTCQAYNYNLQRTCDPLIILLLLVKERMDKEEKRDESWLGC